MARTAAQRKQEGTLSASQRTVRAKRKAVSVKALKAKAEAGEDTTGDRALIRMGAGPTAILIGTENVSDWTDEELRRGQRMDKSGNFRGRPMKVIPKVCYDELVRRTMNEATQKFTTNLVAAVEALVSIATSDVAEDKDRLRAIQMITDRAMGKAPDKLELTGHAKWEVALQAGIVSVDNMHEEPDTGEDGTDDGDDF